MALYKSDNAIFYHPLDSKVESTQGETWTGTPDFGSGIISSGLIGSSTTSGILTGSSGAYDNVAVGASSKTWAFWFKSDDKSMELDGSNSYLSSTSDVPSFSIGSDDFTFATWARLDDLVGSQTLVAKNGTNRSEYGFFKTTANVWRVIMSNNGIAFPLILDGTTTATTGTWHFLAFTKSGSVVTMYLNNNFEASGSMGDVNVSTANVFNLGAFEATSKLDGLMDKAGMWRRALTSGELVTLYNSGFGKQYKQLTSGEKVDLISYWDLNETNLVSRSDSHSSGHLTVVNPMRFSTKLPGE